MMDYFELEQVGDVTVIKLSFNEIGFRQREELKEELIALISGEGGNFVINISRIGFLSSLVIATLISFMKEVNERKGKVALCSVTESAKYTLQVTRMDQAFELYDTEEQAIAGIQG